MLQRTFFRQQSPVPSMRCTQSVRHADMSAIQRAHMEVRLHATVTQLVQLSSTLPQHAAQMCGDVYPHKIWTYASSNTRAAARKKQHWLCWAPARLAACVLSRMTL